jgi:hypothetical protein
MSAARNLVTEDEVRQMAIPIVGRRERDFLSPFAPSGTFERLTIQHLEVFQAEDRFWAQYQIDEDATTLGTQWAAFLRAATFPALLPALHQRDAGHHELFLNELEYGVAARFAAAPEQMRIPLALVVIEKKERSHH